MPCPGSEREKGRPQTPRDAEVHSGLDVDSLQVWRQAAVAYATGSDPGRGLADLFLGCQGGGDSGLDRRVSLDGQSALQWSGMRWRSVRTGHPGLSLRRT